MNKTYSAPERSFIEALRDLGAPESVNWRVYLLVGVPFMLSALTLEQVRFGGPLGRWLFFGLVFWFVTVLIIEFLFFLFRKRKWKKSRPVAVILILVLAGIIRGALVFLTGNQVGLIPASDLLYRLMVGPIFVVVGVALMHVIVASYLRDAQLNAELQYRQQELKFLELTLADQISQLRESLLDKVNNQLRPELRKLYKKLAADQTKSDLEKSVTMLMSIVDQIVRPLSRDLALTRSIPRASETKKTINPFLVQIPKRVQLGSMIPLPLMAALYLLLGFPSLAVQTDPLTAIGQIAIVGTLNLSLFGLAKFLLNKVSIHPAPGFVIVFATALAASQVNVTVEMILPLNLSDQFAFQTFTFNAAMVTVLYIYQLIKTQVLLAQDKIQEVVRKLELFTSSLRQEAWVIQRNIATVLHGPVQAAMYAAALRLSQAKKPSEKLASVVKQEIDQAISRLAKPDYLEGESLRSVLQQIQDLWSGLAQVRVNLEEALNNEISKQPIAAQCALEIAREGVSNAVKHGKASKIEVSIEKLSSEMLQVKVTNDGLSPEQSEQFGVGTALLNDLSHSWEIRERENKTELVALVSLAKRD